MSINNNILYKREIDLKALRSSCFLIGPRMTGKTYLLNQLKATAYFDLLEPQLEIQFRSRPHEFWEELSLLKSKSLVVVDEIQKVPQLLDYVQMGSS
ncbi:MAG: AAA family ATPase [Oligoflexia bacterium]|nr:AAA family ATPase [Oligoflexia bacterium]